MRMMLSRICLPALLAGSLSVAAPVPAATNAQTNAAGETVLQVHTGMARDQFVHPQRQVLASVVARNESRISAEVSGLIRSLGAQVGELVAKGAVLARIDATDANLMLAQARAQRAGLMARLDLARRQFDRARDLHAQGFMSVEAVNQRESEKLSLAAEQARLDSQITQARRAIEKTVIRAPFEAVVRERMAQLGELAAPGTALYLLVQTGAPEVSVAVPIDDARWLAGVNEFRFEVAGRAYPLELLRVSPIASAGTRTREARLRFAEQPLAPGVEGRLLWRDPRPHLPAELLVRRAGQLGVFALKGGHARFEPIVGAQEGRPAFTRLAADTRLVLDGRERLQDGDPVAAAQ